MIKPSIMPRFQSIVIPILRDWPALEGVKIGSWVEDIDYREFPMLNVCKVKESLGRDFRYPNKLETGVIELTAYSMESLIECEHLFNHALEALYDAVLYQKCTDTGYLHSIRENMGMTLFDSRFMDSWRVQGLVQLGLRPL